MLELPEDAIDLGVTERDHQGGFGGFGKTTAAPRMRDLPGDRYRMVAIPEPAPPEPTITELCQEINQLALGMVHYVDTYKLVELTAKIAELSEAEPKMPTVAEVMEALKYVKAGSRVIPKGTTWRSGLGRGDTTWDHGKASKALAPLGITESGLPADD